MSKGPTREPVPRRVVGLFDLLGTKAAIENGKTRHLVDQVDFVDKVRLAALESVPPARAVHLLGEAPREHLPKAVSLLFEEKDPLLEYQRELLQLMPILQARVAGLRFSDTILLYGPDDSPESFSAVAMAGATLVGELLSGGVPVRGAIVADEMEIDAERDIYFGKALLRAFEEEKLHNWAGATISSACADKYANRIVELQTLGFLHKFAPPLQPPHWLRHRLPAAIAARLVGAEKWCLGWPRRVQQNAEDIRAMLANDTDVPSGAYAKIEGTIRFMRSYRRTHPKLKLTPAVRFR